MARCRNCKTNVGGGFFKKHNDGVIKYKLLPLIHLYFCSEDCKKSYGVFIQKIGERISPPEPKDERNFLKRYNKEQDEFKEEGK